ncbi:uncharacterized protein LOC131071878 [Cryptomeria japonica]|uniref:uncharacterized protein LOC131071878 n=1 Tax=Cryptomeria japonica TaxID=3369 RepID=UPI0027DA3FD2|nr:uncharacterized protein LOC131071878 [Cryptomeria japonica]
MVVEEKDKRHERLKVLHVALNADHSRIFIENAKLKVDLAKRDSMSLVGPKPEELEKRKEELQKAKEEVAAGSRRRLGSRQPVARGGDGRGGPGGGVVGSWRRGEWRADDCGPQGAEGAGSEGSAAGHRAAEAAGGGCGADGGWGAGGQQGAGGDQDWQGCRSCQGRCRARSQGKSVGCTNNDRGPTSHAIGQPVANLQKG